MVHESKWLLNTHSILHLCPPIGHFLNPWEYYRQRYRGRKGCSLGLEGRGSSCELRMQGRRGKLVLQAEKTLHFTSPISRITYLHILPCFLLRTPFSHRFASFKFRGLYELRSKLVSVVAPMATFLWSMKNWLAGNIHIQCLLNKRERSWAC